MWSYRYEMPNAWSGRMIREVVVFDTQLKAQDSRKRAVERLSAKVSNIVEVDYGECK